MIGHYLLALTEAQEDRALTETFEPYRKPEWMYDTTAGSFTTRPREKTRCLVDVACDLPAGSSWKSFIGRTDLAGLFRWQFSGDLVVGDRYDKLGNRFGVPRINTLIRNRILSNRARRTLQHRPVEAVSR